MIQLYPESFPALIVALNSPSKNVRWQAAIALRDLADPRSAKELINALEDENACVQWATAEGVIALGTISRSGIACQAWRLYLNPENKGENDPRVLGGAHRSHQVIQSAIIRMQQASYGPGDEQA